MFRFIALAASVMLVSLTPVAPAMADDGLATAPVQPAPVRVLAQQMSTAPVVAKPPVFAPLTSIGTTGLAGIAPIAAGIGAALAFGTIVTLAATDDDDTSDSAVSTN